MENLFGMGISRKYLFAVLGVVTVLAVYIFSLFFKKKRFFRYPVAMVSGGAVLLFALFSGDDLKNITVYSLVILLTDVSFLPLLKLGKKRKTKRVSEGMVPVQKEYDLQNVAPMPEFYAVNEVKLGFALQTARALKERNLSVKDRMDVDIIYNLLQAFDKKERLTGTEVSELNKGLSRLLKLVSAYTSAA